MKKITLFLIAILWGSFAISQTRDKYILEVKPGYELGAVSKTTNPDQTINVLTARQDLNTLINSVSSYSLVPAFPTAPPGRLARVYTIEFASTVSVQQFASWEGTAVFFMIDPLENALLSDSSVAPPIDFPLPNDYPDAFTGAPNYDLELIKAPLAWSITPGGSADIIVGVDDSVITFNHVDLEGQILYNIAIGPIPLGDTHGTRSCGIIAAKTNNGTGVASLAHNTKLITANTNGSAMPLIDGLLQLAQQPGVRVINCSWALCANHPSKPYLDEVMAYVTEKNILVVAGAGNGAPCGDGINYYYPASYNESISVTAVGCRFSIGDYNAGLIPSWDLSWKDCWPRHVTEGGFTTNDKIDVSAPGQLALTLSGNYDIYPSGVRLAGATSTATPFVTALAALVFSVNPSLTPLQVRDIIRNTTDDISYIPYNQPYSGIIGTGRINAYRAVLTAKCMLQPNPQVDLAMQDTNEDVFQEPNINSQYAWTTKDIWVRNQQDGKLIKDHQNPIYNQSGLNYAYVRITNNSCVQSIGNEKLKLYWAKASTNEQWPESYDGSLTVFNPATSTTLPMGGLLTTVNIPILGIGEETILEIPWPNVPNPNDYVGVNSQPWHFCLLARIDATNDPMTFPETADLLANILNNNNIVLKNLSVIEIVPNTPKPVAAAVAVRNHKPANETYYLEFKNDPDQYGKPIYNEAEVSVEMDPILYAAWVRGGRLMTNMRNTNIDNIKVVTDDNAVLDNIMFTASELGTMALQFNFLTKEITDKQKYVYNVVQRQRGTNKIIGGETYEIQKKRTEKFFAFAGNDKIIDKNDTTTLTASQVNEDAVYNWYDVDGNLIFTGSDLTVSPSVTTKYKLEIVSNVDGFKDYDELEVTVKPYALKAIAPNPASSDINFNYVAEGSSSAYLMIVNTANGSSENHILNTSLTTKTINIANFSNGIYNM